MNVKQLFTATLAALALSPFAAYAEGGGSAESQAWLASIHSSASIADVRAGLEQLPLYVEQHPVELAQSESTLTRRQVLQELATYGTIRVGA